MSSAILELMIALPFGLGRSGNPATRKSTRTTGGNTNDRERVCGLPTANMFTTGHCNGRTEPHL